MFCIECLISVHGTGSLCGLALLRAGAKVRVRVRQREYRFRL